MIKSYSSSLRAHSFRDKVLEELDASESDEALRLLRQMKELLAQYRAERKKLRKLGLQDLEDVIEVMRSMKRRTEKLKSRLDGYREAHEKLHAIQNALDLDATDEETLETIRDISEEIESLHEEREVLSRAGVSDADEAVKLIQSMRTQLDEVYRQMDQQAAADSEMSREDESHAGPESLDEVLDNTDARTSGAPGAELDDGSIRGGENSALETRSVVTKTLERQMLAAQRGDATVPSEEIAPLLSKETLSSLDDRSDHSLEDLGVGMLGIGEDDTIRVVTSHRPMIPNADEDAVGSSFFSQVPAARNPLLQKPIEHAQRTGRLDTRFIYTFPRDTAGSAVPLRLHLYRASEEGLLWILHDAVE